MMNELIAELNARGADFIKAVDISELPEKENMGYGSAVLIGIALSPKYIFDLSKDGVVDYSEFSEKESKMDKLAEWAADFIAAKGYKALAQSERNLNAYGLFDSLSKTSPLPHKTIAVLAGLGWIGKSDLLVTKQYGSALCMCSVLTNAPLHLENRPVTNPECGECTACKDICPAGVIHGATWEIGMNRDSIIDVYHCKQCLKCLVHCPWTLRYMKEVI